MKLSNFRRLDPSYSGTSLERGGKLEEEIWVEFAPDRVLLAQTAAAIREGAVLLDPPRSQAEADEYTGDEEFPEGRILTRTHRQRERNRTLVKKKKAQVLQTTGRLLCEACRFDFEQFYGDMGRGFAECHHNKPLAEAVSKSATRLSDLSIVCANCHRMLHRTRPWLSVAELRDRLKSTGKLGRGRQDRGGIGISERGVG